MATKQPGSRAPDGAGEKRRTDVALFGILAGLFFVAGAALVLSELVSSWRPWLNDHVKVVAGGVLLAGALACAAIALGRYALRGPAPVPSDDATEAWEDASLSAFERLRGLLERDSKRFDSESRKHKKIDRFCRTAALAIAALTTTVGGSAMLFDDEGFKHYGKTVEFLVLCLTALATAINAWADIRRARELWVHDRALFHDIEDIRAELVVTRDPGTMDPEDVHKLFKRRADVLASSSRRWGMIFETPKPAAAPGDPAAKPTDPGGDAS